MARKKAASLPPLSDTLLPAEDGDVLELDELWSFVGCKLNPRWVRTALCRQTRQVVAYFVGDRSADGARAQRERIPPDYRRRATRSDWWLAYTEVFPRAPTILAAKVPARPATSNAGTTRCANAWAVLCAKRSPSPSASGCTKSLCACSCIITTFHSHRNHYPGPNQILRLPKSGMLVKIETIASGNTFGARF